MIQSAILHQIMQQIMEQTQPKMISIIAVINQALLIKLLSNSKQLPQFTNCRNNIYFIYQRLDIRNNIIFWTNKDKIKR